jgi:hypothetical protein
MSDIVKVNCPFCGGSVDQEDVKDGICTCPYCKNVFYIKDIVEQPKINVTHNTTTNTYYMGNIKPDDLKFNLGGHDIHVGNPKHIFDNSSYVKNEGEYGSQATYDAKGNVVVPKYFKGIIGIVLLFMALLFGAIFVQTKLEYSTTYKESDSANIGMKPEIAEKVNLQEKLEIVFAENSSYENGKASIAYNWLDSNYSDIQLQARPKENLGQGDVVHIKITDLGSHSEDEFESLEWDWVFDLMTFDAME